MEHGGSSVSEIENERERERMKGRAGGFDVIVTAPYLLLVPRDDTDA